MQYSNTCVQEGESVILEMNDESRHFLQAYKGRDLRLKGFTIFGASIIGQPYGSVWEVIMPSKGTSTTSNANPVTTPPSSSSSSSSSSQQLSSSSHDKTKNKYNIQLVEDGDLYSEWWKKGTSAPLSMDEASMLDNMNDDDDNDINDDDYSNKNNYNNNNDSSSTLLPTSSSFPFQSGKDNRNLLQNHDSQNLSSEAILEMKAQGKSTEIIQALIANSNTFHTKTVFSQEKYLRKKTAKYVHRFRILKSNAQNVAEMYLLTNPDKIGHVRYDSLGLMLHLANIQPHHNVMLFEQMSGLLVGAVTERMIDDKLILGTRTSYADDEQRTVKLLEQIETRTLPLPPQGKGKIFCAIDDNKVCTNLFLYFRMNLSMDYEAKQLLVSIKYSELTNWIYRIANNDINNDKNPFTDNSTTAMKENYNRKRNRPVMDNADTETIPANGNDNKDNNIGSSNVVVTDTAMDATPSTGTTISSSVPDGFQNRTSKGTIQWVPNKNKAVPSSSTSSSLSSSAPKNASSTKDSVTKSSSSNTASTNTSSSVGPNVHRSGSRQYYHESHFTSYPYTQEQRMSMLAEGIDSLIIAVPTDPSSLFFAAVRYLKPSSSFVIFHRDMVCLAHLFRRIRLLNIAINVQLQETWTREYQILPNRTHPHMSMHNESGFLLSGTIIENPYHCLPLYHVPLTLPSPVLPITIQRKQDYYFMQKACEQAELCVSSPKAYNVGAILVKNTDILTKLTPIEWSECILATGYSREYPGNTHAEEVCFLKSRLLIRDPSYPDTTVNIPSILNTNEGDNDDVRITEDRSMIPTDHLSSSSVSLPSSFYDTPCTLYTTMEPCGERLSNKASCTQLIQQVNQYARQCYHRNCINRIVIGIVEPPHLVPVTTGLETLKKEEITIIHIQDEKLIQRALKVNSHITNTFPPNPSSI